MKKNIEWLRNEVNELPLRFLGLSMSKQREEFAVNKDDVLELINQLDEPETLTQKWIDEHRKSYTMEDSVEISDLQNLLVPEQELPVIPQFVADWVESRDYCNIYKVLQDLSAPGSPHSSKDVRNWIFRNQENVEKFVRAWLDGYEVEEEPQYRLKAGENYLYFNLDGTVRGATKDNATITKERLEQLPFDVDKAVESGIIEVEELEGCYKEQTDLK